MKDKIIQIILEELETLNKDAGLGMDISPGEGTHLYTKSSPLDSLGLVRLLADVEDGIEQEFGVSILIADEQAMSMIKSPFRSVGALAEYAAAKVEKAKS